MNYGLKIIVFQKICDNGEGYNFKNYELSGGKRTFKVQELEVYRVEEN